MKKIHLVLPILAFMLAGVGVFASGSSDVARIYYVDLNNGGSKCDIVVEDDCPGTTNPCVYFGAQSQYHGLDAYFEDLPTISCTRDFED